eukprot:CAMPEP_0194707264 /NCGR_PEP_ID=MMETSP0295-20121207/30051_1 /TAXON_ID=39354 /ORGANISM="Heterosigma akashiwo, Strain CCMP2393" /LENGTH=117 /DNA_ID=CAMNT_0039603359 /DNA_START=516 /DNA_END=868 /DNA_ORIENTATION=-
MKAGDSPDAAAAALLRQDRFKEEEKEDSTPSIPSHPGPRAPGGGCAPRAAGGGAAAAAVLGGALTNADVYVAVTVASLRPSPPPSPSIAGAAPLPPKPFWAAVERVAEFHELHPGGG